jgi:hypothetical protein
MFQSLFLLSLLQGRRGPWLQLFYNTVASSVVSSSVWALACSAQNASSSQFATVTSNTDQSPQKGASVGAMGRLRTKRFSVNDSMLPVQTWTPFIPILLGSSLDMKSFSSNPLTTCRLHMSIQHHCSFKHGIIVLWIVPTSSRKDCHKH